MVQRTTHTRNLTPDVSARTVFTAKRGFHNYDEGGWLTVSPENQFYAVDNPEQGEKGKVGDGRTCVYARRVTGDGEGWIPAA